MDYAVSNLRGANLCFEGLDDGSAIVTITKGAEVNIRFAIPPAAVHGLANALHAIERKGWPVTKVSPETQEYRTKPLVVRATPDFCERRGLYGTPGYEVIYPDGRAEWMVAHCFEQLFDRGGRYWREG